MALQAQLKACGGGCQRSCLSPPGTTWSWPHPPGKGDSCGPPWGRLLLLQLLGLFISDQVQVPGSSHFHVFSPNLSWLQQSFPAGLPGLASFFLGLVCLGCTLSVATASSSSSVSSGTAAATGWDLAL